jgi:hypothetical protein
MFSISHVKTIAIAACSLLLIISSDLSAQTKSYVSSDKIFMLSYPDSWKFSKAETDGEINLNAPGASIFKISMVKMEIRRPAEGYEKADIHEIAEVETKMLKAQQTASMQLELQESAFKKVQDHEWWAVKMKITQKKEVFYSKSYKTIHNGKIYVFTYLSREQDFDKNAAAANQIFESIEFLTKNHS